MDRILWGLWNIHSMRRFMESSFESMGRSCQSLSSGASGSGARSAPGGGSSSGSSFGCCWILSSDRARESACSGSTEADADSWGSSSSRIYFWLTFLGSKPMGFEAGSRRAYCLRREDCQLSSLDCGSQTVVRKRNRSTDVIFLSWVRA